MGTVFETYEKLGLFAGVYSFAKFDRDIVHFFQSRYIETDSEVVSFAIWPKKS